MTRAEKLEARLMAKTSRMETFGASCANLEGSTTRNALLASLRTELSSRLFAFQREYRDTEAALVALATKIEDANLDCEAAKSMK